MKTRWILGLALLLGWATLSHSQIVGPNDPCRHTRANGSGTARADITISLSVVTVLTKDPARCGALVTNVAGVAPIRCAGIDNGDPSGTAGYRINPGSTLDLELAAQEGWKCIRDTTATSDATISILELYQ